MKINEVIVNEQPRTCQIQQETVVRVKSIQTQHAKPKVDQIQSSNVKQKQPQQRKVSTQPIPNQIKHKLIQNRLTKQMMRHSNIVEPSSDDIRIARNRAETELKKADLDFKKRSEADQRQHERHKHSS